jgi:hypothetical protein
MPLASATTTFRSTSCAAVTQTAKNQKEGWGIGMDASGLLIAIGAPLFWIGLEKVPVQRPSAGLLPTVSVDRNGWRF